MKNIFKTFKENKRLIKENETLKAQNDALTQFRRNFDNWYHDISNCKTIIKYDGNVITLKGVYTLDMNSIHYPADECKREIAERLSEQLIPFIEFDVVDNRAYGTKNIVGRLRVVEKE